MAGYEHLAARFAETMAARGFALRTRRSYAQALARFDRFLGDERLDAMPLDRLADYQRHLARQQASFSTFNGNVCALRFFFRHVLGRREWDYTTIPYQREPRRLPEVPSPREVEALLDAAPGLKFRALFMTAYGCGLRLTEIQALRPRHVDSDRMTIHVVHGKGGRDRYVMLPRRLLWTLEECWRQYRPREFLFEGRRPGRPVSQQAISAALATARDRAGVEKHVTLHGLRHAFGTHLVESGVDVAVLQRLLGHSSLASTEFYVHVSRTRLLETNSPLDQLPGGDDVSATGDGRIPRADRCPTCSRRLPDLRLHERAARRRHVRVRGRGGDGAVTFPARPAEPEQLGLFADAPQGREVTQFRSSATDATSRSAPASRSSASSP